MSLFRRAGRAALVSLPFALIAACAAETSKDDRVEVGVDDHVDPEGLLPTPTIPFNTCLTIDDVATSLASRGFVLGARYADQALPGGGTRRPYANTVVFYGPKTCAHEVHSSIFGRYFWMGQEAGALGYPTTDTSPLAASATWAHNNFEHGAIYWQPSTGAHAVTGDVYTKWSALGRQAFNGFPTDETRDVGDGNGTYSEFESGVIYAKASSGAHDVHGAILGKWNEYSRTAQIGYPLTDETVLPDGFGRLNRFEFGSIYWSGATGAHKLAGMLQGKWAAMKAEQGPLGYPTTDDYPTPDGVGRFAHFQGGSIYGKVSDLLFYFIEPAIRDKWGTLGWETSALGWPVSDTVALSRGGKYNAFEHGNIYSHPTAGIHAVMPNTLAQSNGGDIFQTYGANNWEWGKLGYPTDEATDCGADGHIGDHYWHGKRIQNFENGSIMVWFEHFNGEYSSKSDVSTAHRSCSSDYPDLPVTPVCTPHTFTFCDATNTTIPGTGCTEDEALTDAYKNHAHGGYVAHKGPCEVVCGGAGIVEAWRCCPSDKNKEAYLGYGCSLKDAKDDAERHDTGCGTWVDGQTCM